MQPLTFEDISDVQEHGYDPMQAIAPFPFDKNPNSPHPLKQSFSPDKFRTFWFHERNAYNWTYSSERNSRDFYRNKILPTPSIKSTGRPRQYDWSLKYVCRHFRPVKQLDHDRDSIGQQCNASIRIQKVNSQDLINIEYYWRHSHSTGPQARAKFGIGKNERKWLDSQVEQGQTWKGIQNFLIPSDTQLTEFNDNQAEKQLTIPPGLFITYNDFKTRAYRQDAKKAQLNPNVVTSIELWMNTIKSQGGKACFNENGGDLAICWSSDFQLKIMKENTLIGCMDSTHKTVKTLRPKEKKSTLRLQRRYPIISWLRWLRNSCEISLQKFMVDCALPESEAIKSVFGDKVSIYYCHFHVAQLWEKHLKESSSIEDCKLMRPYLRKIRVAESKEELDTLWKEFTTKFFKAKKFIAYVEKNWFKKEEIKARWVIYQRENYQHIDTNNLVESWHKTLKKGNLGNKRNLRSDHLVYKLQAIVNRQMRSKYDMVSMGLRVAELSAYDKRRKAKAWRVSAQEAIDMIDLGAIQDSRIIVKSFTTPETRYTITINIKSRLLISCHCQDFEKNRLPCKHLYLINRIYSNYSIHHGAAPAGDNAHAQEPEPNQNADIDDQFGPPLENQLSENLRMHLQAQRVLTQENAKRAREEERAEIFQECETALKEQWIHAGKALGFIGPKKPRMCTVEYMQSATAAFKHAVREIVGINEVGAGRRCQ